MATAKQLAKQIREEQLDQLNERLERVNTLLGKYEPLVELRTQLLASRRALLGGNKMTGAGGSNVRQEDVIKFLRDRGIDGAREGDIKEAVGDQGRATSGHLQRGKGEWALHYKGRWYARDPKNGINTTDDLEKLLESEDDE